MIMKRLLLLFVIAGIGENLPAQLLTWTPGFSQDNDNISITVDASKGNQGLFQYNPVTDVYVHTGVITDQSTSATNWRYVKFNQDFNQPNAQLQAVSLGANKWRFDITGIRSYYGVPSNESILKIAILFRNGNGSVVQRNANGSDMYIPVYDTSLATRFSSPPFQPLYHPAPEPIQKSTGETIDLTGIASRPCTLKLFLNGTEIQSASGTQTISASPVLSNSGEQVVVTEASNAWSVRSDTLRFFVAPSVTVAPLPPGVRDGINYEPGDTSLTLVLYAPGKNRVSVIGEFPGCRWSEQAGFVMTKTPDNNYWWIRLTGLAPGTEYAFQYLVDGTLKLGEPYAEKVLDPASEAEILASGVYPNLRSYPTDSTSGIVCVVQTARPAYNWAVNNFARPDKRNLVIYELLVRDFVAAHNWNVLRDTLHYLEQLGVNAVEIMPFNEFEGNKSWGYNPDYFLAPDKYYGSSLALKEFIDSCHSKGMAVIMDIALNHTTGLNPLAALYWNTGTSQPAANNPWLNVTATHPFNVFNDFNHQSPATQYFFKRVVEHWLQEYRLDGFRFDLSKGFTQTNSGSNVSLWSQYDASRVALWKKYYDTLQVKSPGSYVILEHFADNSEETELANYGMMLWGNGSYHFQEAGMGYTSNSNFEHLLHTVRGWQQPVLVGYAESHDEERMMYKNLNFGNAGGSHNTRDLQTALRRMELNAAFLLSMPGPKMLWQFGELGYDFSINRCEDGSINANCRTSPKPIRWDYLQFTPRRRLHDIYSSLNKLRFHPWYRDVMTANNVSISRSMAGAFKWLTVRSANDSSVLCVLGNFDVQAQTENFSFPVAGTWYDYLQGGTITATGSPQSMTLQPGEYHVYLNRNLINAVVTAVPGIPGMVNELKATVSPNPVDGTSVLNLDLPAAGMTRVEVLDAMGRSLGLIHQGRLPSGKQQLPLTDKINNLPRGHYLLQIHSGNRTVPVKVVIP